MSSSLPQTATNSQSLNGIISLSDGVITIEDGTITGLDEIDLTDLQVSDTATIENLVVNNQIDMTLGQIKNVATPTDNGDATNKQYVDTIFLNKLTNTTQNVSGRLTFNSTTSGQSFPIIELTNAITGSNNGLYLRFFKNFNRLPNTEIGSIVFADKDAISSALTRAVQLTASIDSASNPLLNITFDSGIFNPLTISNTQTILRNNDLFFINKSTAQTILKYQNASDKITMSKTLDMNTSNKIINIAEPTLSQDVASKFYVDNNSNNGNYLLRDGSLPMLGDLEMGSNNITIGTNNHLAFNSSDLSISNGMFMNYDAAIGYLDVRGSEFRVRTSASGVPNTIRFKINDTNTTVINNFFVDGNTTLGSDALLDTLTMKVQATFPNDSKLTFNTGSEVLFQTGVPITFNNTLNFLSGSYIDGARLRLISSGNSSYTMDNDNIENGVLCTNSSTINITMPAKHAYWNNRSYFVKVQIADVNLVQNTGTSIDNDNTTIGMSSNYRGYHLYFDTNYETNGKIWRLCQI